VIGKIPIAISFFLNVFRDNARLVMAAFVEVDHFFDTLKNNLNSLNLVITNSKSKESKETRKERNVKEIRKETESLRILLIFVGEA